MCSAVVWYKYVVQWFGKCVSLWYGKCVVLWYSKCVVLWYGKCVVLWYGKCIVLWYGKCVALWYGKCVVLWYSKCVSLWYGMCVGLWYGKFACNAFHHFIMTDFFKLSNIFHFVLVAECCGDYRVFQCKCILNCRLDAVIVDGLDTDTYCISVVAGVHDDVHDAHVNTCRAGLSLIHI